MLFERVQGHVVVADADAGEFALLGHAGREDDQFMRAILRVVLADHLQCVHHRAVGRGEVGQELRTINLDVADERWTGLGNDELGFVVLEVFQIGTDGQLGAEADIEDRLHANGGEPTIEMEILVGE